VTLLVDTTVFIDHLRGHGAATDLLLRERVEGALHASEMTRLELLAGMRPGGDEEVRALLAVVQWHAVDEDVAEQAGEFGRRWLRSHGGIDAADLAIAATAVLLDAQLITTNVRHFPMFADLRPPY
jgi:predicted nucleic acid-binding protein